MCAKIRGRVYGKVHTCNQGYYFSFRLGACVGELLSDCAKSDQPKTHYQDLCARTQNDASIAPGSIRYICHPHDPKKFVACPPNVAWARVLSCVGDRYFSATEGKCVLQDESDCAAPPVLESPETPVDLDLPMAAPMVINPNATAATDTASANATASDHDDLVAANIVMVMGPNSNVTGNNTAAAAGNDTASEDGPDAAPMRHWLTPAAHGLPTGPSSGAAHGLPSGASSGAAIPNAVPTPNPWSEIPTQQPPYCPDSAPFPVNCVPKPNSAPRSFYPQNPTYPVNPRDPRRFGPGPHPFGAPPAACKARYLYHPEVADWEGARAICELEGGQLAVITSEREQGRIASRFGKLKEFWIGATDIEREGQFRWVNGQGLGFARWYRSQPNKKYPNNEHCVTFNYWGKDAKWGDRNCYDSRPFLCETMICEPMRNRFPTGFPGGFNGPLRSPINFPRYRNFPGPRGIGGVSARHWPRGRGFPYNSWQDLRTPING